MNGVTVVIPTVAPRGELLARALRSVSGQTSPPDGVNVVYDTDRQGAGPTRTRGLRAVTTEWTAFLDDDDELYECHLECLLRHQAATGADLVYPWYDIVYPGGRIADRDVLPFEGLPWDPAAPRLFPITYLVRTEIARSCTFPPVAGTMIGPHGQPENPNWSGDDWPFILQLVEAGARIEHLDSRTWAWHHHGVGSTDRPGNTSGRPDRVNW